MLNHSETIFQIRARFHDENMERGVGENIGNMQNIHN